MLTEKTELQFGIFIMVQLYIPPVMDRQPHY